MASTWTTIIREKATAEANMAMDAMLLRRLACVHKPVLHLYEWEAPSITHGYFVDPNKLLSLPDIHSLGMQLARRPTGGGVIVHTTDLAFSILLPSNHPAFSTNTLENYAYINKMVAGIVKEFLPSTSSIDLLSSEKTCSESYLPFCMADPTVYDVMIEGKKVAGGAQRRTKYGYLHQGSISLAIPEKTFLERVIKDPAVSELMKKNTYPLAGERASLSDIDAARKILISQLQCSVEKLL